MKLQAVSVQYYVLQGSPDSPISDFPRVLYSRVLLTSMGFFGGPTDRVGDSFNFFVCPLSKLCISDMHLHVSEKHAPLEL